MTRASSNRCLVRARVRCSEMSHARHQGASACGALAAQLASRRESEGRHTLLAMGFTPAEVDAVGTDTLMDVAGVVVMTAFYGDQGQ